MNTDEQVLRERLRGVIGRFEAGPAPVNAVMRRGKAIRARRRAIAASGTAALAAVLAVVVWAQTAGAPGPVVASGPGVTLNVPDPQAPGGVFASGTADGRPWQLAVRNIAGPAPWCLPAVMLNGHNGDVLFGVDSGTPTIGKPAFLTHIPGRPGLGVAFVHLPASVTKIVADLPGGGSVSQRPVTLTLCGQRFHLAGFAFGNPQRGVTRLSAYSALGLEETLPVPPATFTERMLPSGTFSAGVWYNFDASAADNQASSAVPVSSGRIDGISWTIKSGLGEYGQCYAASTVVANKSGTAFECLPVEAPPRGIALARVPFPAATPVPITGYAGLVSPRTAYVIASFADGTTRRLTPALLSGRGYVALAIPHGARLIRLISYDAAGHPFASTTSVPPAG